MDSAALAQALWADIGAQRWDALAAYFLPGALIFWHNTDECFTVEEFVRANREYPGNWRIEIERVHVLADAAATAVRVYGCPAPDSCTRCYPKSLHDNILWLPSHPFPSLP